MPTRSLHEPSTEIIDPRALSPTARHALTDELYAAHRMIFSGVDRRTFAAYVVDSPAERTRIQVFRHQGSIVGYAAFHVFEREVQGRACLVLRAEVGLLPAYRRATRFGPFLLRQVLHALRERRGRPVWGLSCATNPATYRSLHRHCDRVWPCPERPTPPALHELMSELAECFEMAPVEGARAGVFHVGWRTRQSEDETRRWARCSHTASRFYLGRNPGYTEGHGMLILVPVTRGGMLRTGLRLVLTQLRRRIGRARQRVAIPTRAQRPVITDP